MLRLVLAPAAVIMLLSVLLASDAFRASALQYAALAAVRLLPAAWLPAGPVLFTTYDVPLSSDEAQVVMEAGAPARLLASPVNQWPALSKWSPVSLAQQVLSHTHNTHTHAHTRTHTHAHTHTHTLIHARTAEVA